MKLYTIKPLEWKRDGDGESAKTLLGRVWVWQTGAGTWHWGGDDLAGKRCASLADGQAQAEACWQARLAGVLEEQK